MWIILTALLFSNLGLAADSYSILFTCDVHFGLSYREKAAVLDGYRNSPRELTKFFGRANYVVGNLESAVADKKFPPISTTKDYLHDELGDELLPFLKNFNLVSLANNHAMDYG